MIKVDIYSGFLGAGKTTLIKKLIKEAYAGERVVLIENEFGEIGIDGGFLSDAGIEITEMNSGCICCSLVGDFTEALGKVERELSPERIIIEPSGVGKLSDVVRAVKAVNSENLSINCLAVVVDAGKCKMYMKNFGEFFNDQIEHASAVILSHTDVAKPGRAEEAISLIKEHNSDAVIISTALDKISGAEILAAMENKNTLEEALKLLEEEHKHHHEHHHHEHDEDCKCGCHDHDHEHEHHHHEHGEDCKCGCHDHDHEHEHHHHEHDEDCKCGCHDHEHEHEHEHHHHEHDEDCKCGCHDHDHEHEHHHHEHGEDCKCGCHGGHHHHADEVFDSFGVETVKKFEISEIENALEAFDEDSAYGMILRAKGIVEAVDGRFIHFDYVPGEPNVRYGTASVVGRLCVIGAGINKEKIKTLFGI